MKHIGYSTWSGAAAAALITSIGLTLRANAVSLVYEEGPNDGQAFVGPIEIKLQNFDIGTLYGTPFPGPVGYTGSPNPALVAGGIGTVNGLPVSAGTIVPSVPAVPGGSQRPPTLNPLAPGGAAGPNAFAWPGTIVPGSPEDAWGILRVSEILELSTGFKVWTPTGKQSEITGIFYGLQDFYVAPSVLNPATDVVINSAGLKLNLYEQAFGGGFTAFDPALGPGARTGASAYPTVTDGTLFLSIESTPGFIHANVGSGGPSAVAGGAAAEYEALFNPGSLTGLGIAFGNVVGGAQALQFDGNGISSPAGAFNFGAGIIPSAFTDIRLSFTSLPDHSGSGWLVRSNDPINGNFVPEPGSAILLGLGGVLLNGVLLGRSRQRKLAAAPR